MISKTELTRILMEILGERKISSILRIGTTGDYIPFTWWNDEKGIFEGTDIDLTREIAGQLGADPVFVPTTWKNMLDDLASDKFDMAIGGISITATRCKKAWMSPPYCENSKTILCRCGEENKYGSLAEIDKDHVHVAVNRGGTNETFARAYLKNCRLRFYEDNLQIPALIADGTEDIMISEIEEVRYYCRTDARLSSSYLRLPFEARGIGVIIRKNKNTYCSEIEPTGSIIGLSCTKNVSGFKTIPRTIPCMTLPFMF